MRFFSVIQVFTGAIPIYQSGVCGMHSRTDTHRYQVYSLLVKKTMYMAIFMDEFNEIRSICDASDKVLLDYSDVAWVISHLRSPVTRLFVQQHIQIN